MDSSEILPLAIPKDGSSSTPLEIPLKIREALFPRNFYRNILRSKNFCRKIFRSLILTSKNITPVIPSSNGEAVLIGDFPGIL